ncbi:ATP-binding cassette domain-containing protein (plasmid) [Paraclostridium bifermentans]|uniref:ATP-binding cassette domain-containing protein n=1 Tax=Paraclostridium bifermentans TaxID=1490 RepID=A0ABY8R8U5_PARBF|nr:ATP-binding cassette domain-containing protein [Paraclostridium bifermentans]
MNYSKTKKKYLIKNICFNKNNSFKLYTKYIKPFILELCICFLFVLIFTLANLAYPYFLKLIIDDALVDKSVYKLFTYTAVMLFTVIIMLVSKYLVANKSLLLCQKLTLKIRQTITEQLIKYSQTFFREYENGQIISIIENDLQNVQNLAIYMITEFLVAIITTIGLLVIIFTINYQIAIACILLLVIYTYLQNHNGKKIKSNSLELSKNKGSLYSHTQELVFNISDIKMLNYHKEYKKIYNNKCERYFEVERSVVHFGVWSNIIGIIFKNLGLILVLCLGGYMVLIGDMSVGILFTLTIYAQQLFSPIITLTNLYVELKKIQASFKRISTLINNDDYVIEDGYIYPDKPLHKNIILKDFSFKYGDDIIFNKANLKIENESKIALLGNNGSGKTTLIRLFMRLQKDYEGKIILDGHNIEDYKLDYLRNNIICISQNPWIFNGTILENILLYNKEIPKETVEKVIRLVCLEEDIKNMPNGLNTIIGDKGISLSGGQKQKIALARVFVTNHSIIVLDEPTSALDLKSEKIICENIYKYLNKKTIIAITHRKEILEHCSNIYEIKDAQIIETKSMAVSLI